MALAILSRDEKIDFVFALAEKRKRVFKENPFQIIRSGKLKIKTIDSRLISFIPNPIQIKLLNKIEQLWHENKPIRMLILKARREGVSTLIEAIIYVLTAYRQNVNSFIVSRDADQASTLFDMSKLYYYEMKADYPLETPNYDKNNAKELQFNEIKSMIRIKSAKDASAARGDTYQLAHLSEIAFYQNADELMTGLQQAISDVPKTMIICETTANGVGGYFYSRWQAAINKENEWTPLFFAWFDFPDYQREFETEPEEINLRETLGKDHRYNRCPGEENDLIKTFKCNLLQLNWRRYTIRNKCDGELDKFYQEYPAYPEQAFLVSGRPRFDAHKTKQIYEYTLQYELENPPQVGHLEHKEKTPDKIEFIPDTSGDWTIYENPKKDTEYSIFVDPAGGEEVEGTPEGKKGDFCVIEVFKRGDLFIQVAEYRSRIDPDLLAGEAYKVHLAYNRPKIGVEVNNMGRSTVDHLKHKADIYRREIQDEVTKKITKKLGWFTDRNTKKTMIDELASFIRDDLIIIRSKTLASECMTYVIGADGSTNAQGGCFDDCVMSTAGCLQMHLRTPKKSAYKVIEMRHGK